MSNIASSAQKSNFIRYTSYGGSLDENGIKGIKGIGLQWDVVG